MHSDAFNTTLNIAAVGELVADKLPFVPARTAPVGLAARAVSGGLSGAAVARANKNKNVTLYAILGSAIAAGATYAFYHLRKAAGNKTGIADPVIALIEDAVVVGVGLALVKTSK